MSNQLVEAAMAVGANSASEEQMIMLDKESARREDTDSRETVIYILRAEVLRLREQLRWVPVAERLPREPGEFEIYGVGSLSASFVRTSYFDGYGFTSAATHWRPLTLPEGRGLG